MFNWSKQTILLTGGTGTFGRAFTKMLLKKHPPKILRIYSRDEYKQFLMQQEFKHSCLRFLIGDVRDRERLRRAVSGTTLIIHAAAMKQIVACEYNPAEAVNTNINGTINVVAAGIDAKVERIVGLITDKSVSPLNLYGATKLCMEKIMIQENNYVGKGRTKISCVRYGNVANSRGSVIPLFQEQKKQGYITLTHEKMTRFWITIENAVEFVIQAIEQMKGGEIFIPKMPSFNVTDLAKVIAPKIKKKIIGIRVGEKIHEDLISQHEARSVREYKKYYLIIPQIKFHDAISYENSKGKRVAEGFSYNSNNNPNKLSASILKNIIKSF